MSKKLTVRGRAYNGRPAENEENTAVNSQAITAIVSASLCRLYAAPEADGAKRGLRDIEKRQPIPTRVITPVYSRDPHSTMPLWDRAGAHNRWEIRSKLTLPKGNQVWGFRDRGRNAWLVEVQDKHRDATRATSAATPWTRSRVEEAVPRRTVACVMRPLFSISVRHERSPIDRHCNVAYPTRGRSLRQQG